jgi:hypothetical protein
MPFSERSKRRFVQKAFWLQKSVANRLAKIVKLRKKKEPKYTERIAMSLALRAFVASEEAELAIDRQTPGTGNS